jgi:hypothetical protein
VRLRGQKILILLVNERGCNGLGYNNNLHFYILTALSENTLEDQHNICLSSNFIMPIEILFFIHPL